MKTLDDKLNFVLEKEIKIVNVPIDELKEYPLNYELVGHITQGKRKLLKEDIAINGIKEPLAIYYTRNEDNTIKDTIIVSGHERLSIAKEIGLKTLPCIVKEFKNEIEIKQYIFSVNFHRKAVVSTEKLLKELYPKEEYPLLYEDLRGNFSTGKSNITASDITPNTKKEKQKELKNEVIKTLGINERTLSNKVSSINKNESKKSNITASDITLDFPKPTKEEKIKHELKELEKDILVNEKQAKELDEKWKTVKKNIESLKAQKVEKENQLRSESRKSFKKEFKLSDEELKFMDSMITEKSIEIEKNKHYHKDNKEIIDSLIEKGLIKYLDSKDTRSQIKNRFGLKCLYKGDYEPESLKLFDRK